MKPTMEKPVVEPTPTIATLSEHKFFVPAYQRGYRWTPEEVRDLLDDIRHFAERAPSDADEFYCLQPLVVRWMEDSGEWEVIDGQQRLTTIYLIARYINEIWCVRTKDRVFSLRYQSRAGTEKFLNDLAVGENGTVAFNTENIEFAHISKAYAAIHLWATTLGDSLNQAAFVDALRHRVRVTWYEPLGTGSVQIFTRINSGKIPLTNAELIRGLFLKSSNFVQPTGQPHENELARLRQMEMAGEWDRIEASLHEDQFWLFLTDKDDPAETRIDLIFRLLTGEDVKDSYALFRVYAKDFSGGVNGEAIQKKWDEVKACYQQLQDWYQDWELYHLIGYLIATGTPLNKLWAESREIRKSKFRANVRALITASIPSTLDGLVYGAPRIRNVLLLHNMLTALKSKDRHFRFPINRFKGENWDVEHIHSVAEEQPESERHQREWLDVALEHIKDAALKNEIEAFKHTPTGTQTGFDSLYLKVLKHFSEKGEVDSTNDVSNLVLLDSSTNRGYKNAVFPVKRATIIQREREGKFIPIATKNAFMKYYSKSIDAFTFWSESDRQAYHEDIQITLAPYLKKEEGQAI
jgi:hypothetical protein